MQRVPPHPGQCRPVAFWKAQVVPGFLSRWMTVIVTAAMALTATGSSSGHSGRCFTAYLMATLMHLKTLLQ